MTTERGIPNPKAIRHAVNVLTDRRDYLAALHDERAAAGLATYLVDVEVAALDLAIPLLEVEWDTATRLLHLYGQNPPPLEPTVRRHDRAQRQGAPA